jgi:A/G-specific adenine glycosylase
LPLESGKKSHPREHFLPGSSGLKAVPDTTTSPYSLEAVAGLRASLLAWYDNSARDLPWRQTRDPYAIWVSEIMLQQTRVAAVTGRYSGFLSSFASVAALAAAPEDEILALWSGLGYYRRARMLHRAAQVVVQEHNGVMPATASELRTLPGIGAYTSAAIASIAYGEPVAVVDGNVERVVQRLAGWGSAERGGQANLAQATERLANQLLDPARPGDFNQGMMELGATVCLPRNPKCSECPIQQHCLTQGEHPKLQRAKMRSQEAAYALVIRDRRGTSEVLLDQRSQAQTVMPGMWELPTLREVDVPIADLRMTVRHAIMQVNYYVRIRSVVEEEMDQLAVASETRRWIQVRELQSIPLTGLARKVLLRARLPELAIRPEIPQPELPRPAKRGNAVSRRELVPAR